jgi:hypothetical protein
VDPHDARPTVPAWSGNGHKPQSRYRDKPSSVAALAAGQGRLAKAQLPEKFCVFRDPVRNGAGAPPKHGLNGRGLFGAGVRRKGLDVDADEESDDHVGQSE